MTKQNPEKLCNSCKDFDYMMNRKDGTSLDVLVICDHDEDDIISIAPINPLKIEINIDHFRKKFTEIFEKWDHELSIGMLPEDKETMMNDIINCLMEKTDEK